MDRLLESFPHRFRLYDVDTFGQFGKKQRTIGNRFENLGSVFIFNDNFGTAYIILILQRKTEL